MGSTYSEADLIEPAIVALCEYGSLRTTKLSKILRKTLSPSGEDLKLLDGRSDDRFSQKVRNLKSHNTLEKLGLAEYEGKVWTVTPKGEKFVRHISGVTSLLRRQGFTVEQRSNAIEDNWEGICIEEGAQSQLSVKVRKRSSKLRKAAIEKYSDSNGYIECMGCGFEGSKFYGKNGKGLIEIHHLEPICEIDGNSQQTIKKALEKVVPLCPNCHRIVHRNSEKMLTIEELKEIIVK